MRNTTLCYIEQDGKYLMLHRVKKKNDINHDKWIGIGGKFEARESPEDCLLREAWEETGLTLTRWRYRGIVTFVAGPDAEAEYMHLFTADGFEGQIKTCDEGDLEWIEKKRLLELTLWEGDKIFLRLLEEDAPFFSLKLVYDGDKLTDAVLDGVPINPVGWDALIPPLQEPPSITNCHGGVWAPRPTKTEKEPLLISACPMDGVPVKPVGSDALIPPLQEPPSITNCHGGVWAPRPTKTEKESPLISACPMDGVPVKPVGSDALIPPLQEPPSITNCHGGVWAPRPTKTEKEPLLISACLMGAACRYDGGRQPLTGLERLMDRYHLIPVCAEQLGGLPTPRVPAERVGTQVLNRDGQDVTAQFETGAAEVLRLAKQFGCAKALLKERSPSCGHGQIYDGSFSGRKIPGSGVTAELLALHGLQIYGESRWEELL